VWVPFPGPHKQLMSRDRSLDFDNEVYPVGFVSDLGIFSSSKCNVELISTLVAGIVVGLTQGVSIGLGTPLPFFEIHTKTHPFLHSILRNKIESFDDAQALRCVLHIYFGDYTYLFYF
jgi:RIC1